MESSTLRDRVLDWGATVASVGGVFAGLAVFDVLQRVAMPFGPRAHQRMVSGMARACNLATRLAGTRYVVAGREHLEPGANYIIVMNHQSVFDIAMASEFLAELQPRYVSKRELARGMPGISYNLREGGSALIDRKDARQAHAEIERLAQRVREDHWSVVIFPEGTRSKTGAMKTFRDRGLKTLVRNAPGVKVLPITTGGGSRLFRHGLRPVVRNVEMSFRIHAPVAPASPDDDTAWDRFVRELYATICGGLPAEDRAVHDAASASPAG